MTKPLQFCGSSGTLQNRSLADLIQKEDLVVSEYLTTLLVFVPRSVTRFLFFLLCCITGFNIKS